MARSKNCLHCEYCRVFDRSGALSDWRCTWSCDYYLIKGYSTDKGSDPDNCLLFKAREGGYPALVKIALEELAEKEEAI